MIKRIEDIPFDIYKKVFRQKFHYDLNVNLGFFEMGIDDLDSVEFLMELEKEIGGICDDLWSEIESQKNHYKMLCDSRNNKLNKIL